MSNEEILSLVKSRSGHFAFESGYHGDLWFDLETLCESPGRLDPFIEELARRVQVHDPEVICGPLVEGALVALLVASKLRCRFVYALRSTPSKAAGKLFPVEYRIPPPLYPAVEQKRVMIVNDVISAGSAVRGAYDHLCSLEAKVVGIAALAVLGDEFQRFAAAHELPLVSLLNRSHRMWEPRACPLCAQGVPLEHPGNA